MPIGRPCLGRDESGRRCPRLAVSGSYCPRHGRADSEPWRKLYTLRQWFLAAEAAKNRAGHRCEKCSARKGLQVHHEVKLADLWAGRTGWHDFVREACDLSKLRVLCVRCHRREERRS